MDNLEEMEKFLEMYNLLRLNQESDSLLVIGLFMLTDQLSVIKLNH